MWATKSRWLNARSSNEQDFMPTLSELIADRRAAIEQFKSDIYGHDDYDISVLNEAIEKTPVVSKEDALAIIDLIRDEATEPEQHLIQASATALRKFIEGL
jgi:hypothetical protein